MVESDIARLARLSGLDTAQVRYDLKEHCILKGNQLKVTISDNKALKIISEKRNKLVWFDSRDVKPNDGIPHLVSNYGIIVSDDMHSSSALNSCECFYWAYITPDMLPKGE